MPTPAIVLAYAPAACVLAGNDIANGSMFGATLDPLLDQKIYAIYKVAKKIYDYDPTYDGMIPVCNMLWEFMSKYGIMAQSYSGGGGAVAPASSYFPLPIEFFVDGSTLIPTGASMVTLDGTNGTPDLRMYNVEFNRNWTPQGTVDPGNGATYFGWNRVTGVFTLYNGVAQATENFRLIPSL